MAHDVAHAPLLGLLEHHAIGERGGEGQRQGGGRVHAQDGAALEREHGGGQVEREQRQRAGQRAPRPPRGGEQARQEPAGGQQRELRAERGVHQVAVGEDRLDRIGQHLGAPHARVRGGRRRVLVHAAEGEAQDHDAVTDAGGIDAPVQDVHERQHGEGVASAEVDSHPARGRERDRAAGGIDLALRRRLVHDHGPPDEARAGGQGDGRQLLAAGAHQQRHVAHDCVGVRGDVDEALAGGGRAHGRRRAHEEVELLRDARRRPRGARALGLGRRQHVAEPAHDGGQLAVVGPGSVEEDVEHDHARTELAQPRQRLCVERPRPVGLGAVAGEQLAVAALVDRHQRARARGLGGTRQEEPVDGARLYAGEVAGQEAGAERDGHDAADRRADEQAARARLHPISVMPALWRWARAW